MSLQIRVAKAQGDPGLFGFIGKAVGTLAKTATSFIPGPAGAIARGLTSKIFGGGGQQAPLPQVRTLPTFTNMNIPATAYSDVPTIANRIAQNLPAPFQDPRGTFTMPSNGQVGVDATPAIGCPKGYKPNKSGYYRRIKSPGNPEGSVFYIHPESRCVKIRKRNAANPGAADRALNRIQSAKRFATKMNRVTIRKKCD